MRINFTRTSGSGKSLLLRTSCSLALDDGAAPMTSLVLPLTDPMFADHCSSKSREALELCRSGVVKPVSIKTFDVSEITQAYRQFSQKTRVGKIIISLENSQSIVKVCSLLSPYE